MILCDTGPLVALIVKSDQDHARCVASAKAMTEASFLTTWPCVTEAFHLLSRGGGVPAQNELWSYLVDGIVQLHLPDAIEWIRLRELMIQYADAPMDLADASLVVAAERTSIRKIFTLDGHFRAYRIHGKEAFDIVP